MRQVDPAISRFEAQCQRHGLQVESSWVPDTLRAAVCETQTARQRLLWFLYGHWEGLIVYHIRAAQADGKHSSASGNS